MDSIRLDRGRGRGFLEGLGQRRDLQGLAAFVAILVALSLVAWTRGSGPAIAPPSVSPGPVSVAASPIAPPTTLLFVHVAGAVRRPGLYGLVPGSRVMDAVDAAGGPTPSAALGAINLAETVADGMKVEVPRRGQASAQPAAPLDSSPAPSIVNINTADQAALETIPGVGPVTASAILTFRSEIGSFESVDQLLEVDGIGPATLESILPYVTT